MLPVDGSGWFVLRTRPSASAGDPSRRCTISPDSSSTLPVNASDWPSGDQRTLVPESRSPPRRAVVPAARSHIQICDAGRPVRRFDWTV